MKLQMFLQKPLRLFLHCQDHKHSLVKQLLNSVKTTTRIE